MNLRGRVVLITGGRRVGSSLAKLLAEGGAKVAMTYRTSREAIEKAVSEIEAAGSEGLAVEADLIDPEQADRAVAETVSRFGRIDVLVNMASVFERTPFAQLRPRDYHAIIAANLTAPYFAAVAAARAMLRNDPGDRGVKGKIINLGDWSIDRPGKGHLPYIVAKGGLKTMTLAMARELAPHVLVNMVQPGAIEPPPGSSPEQLRATEAQTPLGRIGSPDDANRLILYLLEGTDFATGGCYRIDGGRFLGMDSQDL